MKHFLSGLLLLLCVQASAQVSVTASGGSPATYSTLKAAFDAINAGTHTGAITIELTASTTETASAVLNASGSGSCSYSSIILYPTVSGLSITGNLAVPMIDLNGADNVTFDGRVNATGSAIDLTVTNNNNGNTGTVATFRLINDATSNTIKYCTIRGASLSNTNGAISGGTATSGTICFSTAATGGSGNDNNTISNNNLTSAATRGLNCIFSQGTTNAANSGNTVSNNNFYNHLPTGATGGFGIHLLSATTEWTISDNSFYESGTWNPGNTAFAHINIIATDGNNFSITGNYMGGQQPQCGGGAFIKGSSGRAGFSAIAINVGSTTASSVQGNVIRNWNYSNVTNTRDWSGITISGGRVNVGTVTGNIIGSATGNGSITGTNLTAIQGINLSGTIYVDIRNNVMGSFTNPTTTSSVYGIYMNCQGGNVTIKNNNIGSSTTANSLYASATPIANGQLVFGIRYAMVSGTALIEGNTISSLSNNSLGASYTAGISVGGLATTASIINNYITNLNATNTGGSGNFVYGLYGRNGPTTVGNNIVVLGNSNNGGILAGIAEESGNLIWLHNTIVITGSPTSGSSNSYAYYSTVTTGTRIAMNNLFYNVRSNNGATGKHYAVSLATATGTIEGNDYYCSGSGSVLGIFNNAEINTLDLWKASTGQDLYSVNEDPAFANAGDTATTAYIPATVNIRGGASSLTTDFRGNSRSTIVPTMGAFETAAPFMAVLSGKASICSGATTNLAVAMDGSTGPYTVVYSNGSTETTVENYVSGSSIPVSPNLTTSYSLVSVTDASNAAATVRTVPVTVSVTASVFAGVSITSNDSDNKICAGTSVTFTATPANGGANPVYQWKLNGATVGSNSATYTNNNIPNNAAVFVNITSALTGTCVTRTASSNTIITTVNTANTGDTTAEACVSYTWYGTRYLYTGNYTRRFVNINGCDSIVTLHLTVSPERNWIGGNGNWSNPANWCGGVVPAATDPIIIDNGTVTLDVDFEVANRVNLFNTASMVIAPGKTLSVAAGGTLDFGSVPVIVKSTEAGTGSIGKINGGFHGYGNVTVERYIPANSSRAWRLLSVPTVGAGQTIRQAWQEGDANPLPQQNNLPGYGTQITGAFSSRAEAVAAGFDNNSISASILNWNGTGWSNITSTNQPIDQYNAYFLFIRGERSKSVSGDASNPSATTLRTTGGIRVGDQSYYVNANSYQLLPNPYPSAIDFTGIVRDAGINNLFYIWDSKKVSQNSLGAYQTFSGTNGYQCLLTGGSYTLGSPNTIIESGQAFFVRSNSAGNVYIRESAKTTPGNYLLGFRPAAHPAKLTAGIYENGNQLDAGVVVFDGAYSNEVAAEDAPKMNNPGANIAISRNSKLLAIEGTSLPTDGDEIPFHIWNLQPGNYELQLSFEQLAGSGLEAVVYDRYANYSTPVTMEGNNSIPFSINSDVASANASRFVVRFRKTAATTLAATYSIGPNPVTDRTLNLRLGQQPAGIYRVMVVSNDGKRIRQFSVSHNGNNTVHRLQLPATLAKGSYQVQVINPSNNQSTLQILVQ